MSAQQPSINSASLIIQDHTEAAILVNHVLNGTKYIHAPFEKIISDTLEKTYTGEIQNLIISMPPGMGKTHRVVWSYVIRGLAINSQSRYVHLTFSDKLVQSNSAAIKDVIDSDQYKSLFPYVKIKHGVNAKGLWETTDGGRFVASPSGGQVTGFRGGVSSMTGFTGAILMDDMTSTESAYSQVLTDSINRRWASKFRSRKAIGSQAPFILCMQRIGAEDFTDYLLNKSKIKWHHLVLPAFIHHDYVYTDGGEYIHHNLDEGSLWPEIWTDDEAFALMSDVQYSQNPEETPGDVFEKHWFQLYTELPPAKSWHIYADTASKTNKYNDYTCFQLWVKTYDNKAYMVDQLHDRIRVPQLIDAFIEFRESALKTIKQQYFKETGYEAKPKDIKVSCCVEDKDSGVGLIQGLQDKQIPVRAISRKIGKYARFTKAAPEVRHGNVFLPIGKEFTAKTITQAVQFKQDDSHAFDDRLDPMVDMINDNLVKDTGIAIHRKGIFG
jgi:predicted phage terminase large subunit-like protein